MHDQSRYQCMIARLSVHDQPGDGDLGLLWKDFLSASLVVLLGSVSICDGLLQIWISSLAHGRMFVEQSFLSSVAHPSLGCLSQLKL